MDIELAKKLVEVLEDSGVEAEIYEKLFRSFYVWCNHYRYSNR